MLFDFVNVHLWFVTHSELILKVHNTPYTKIWVSTLISTFLKVYSKKCLLVLNFHLLIRDKLGDEAVDHTILVQNFMQIVSYCIILLYALFCIYNLLLCCKGDVSSFSSWHKPHR